MKLNIKNLSALAILVATAFSSQALAGFGTNAGDIIIGFKTGSGGTFANDMDIAAGNLSTLATYTTTTLIGNFNTSLTAAFGSTWNSGSTGVVGANLLNWGAVGTDNTNNIDYFTKAWSASTVGTLGGATNTTPLSGLSPVIGTASAKILSVGQGYQSGAATADAGAVTNAKASLNAWTNQATTGTNLFGLSGLTATSITDKMVLNSNATFGGFTASAADLYSYQGTSATLLGTFSLATNGNLYFTASAIPEPSTYAAILGVATLGFAAIRRRKQQIDAQV